METSLSLDDITIVRNGRRVPGPRIDDGGVDDCPGNTDDNSNDDECWDG